MSELNQAYKVIRAWCFEFDQNVKDSSGLDTIYTYTCDDW